MAICFVCWSTISSIWTYWSRLTLFFFSFVSAKKFYSVFADLSHHFFLCNDALALLELQRHNKIIPLMPLHTIKTFPEEILVFDAFPRVFAGLSLCFVLSIFFVIWLILQFMWTYPPTFELFPKICQIFSFCFLLFALFSIFCTFKFIYHRSPQ